MKLWVKRFVREPVERDMSLPSLTVFNSSTYASYALVNIFSIQNKLDSWRRLYRELGHSPRTVRRLASYLRYGLSGSFFLKLVTLNPWLVERLNTVEEKESCHFDTFLGLGGIEKAFPGFG